MSRCPNFARGNAHRWAWVYLHMGAEDLVGYDAIETDQPSPGAPGIYPVAVNGQAALAFLWEGQVGLQGLVALLTDAEGLADASGRYTRKDPTL